MNNSADAWYLLKTIIKPLGVLRRSALMKWCDYVTNITMQSEMKEFRLPQAKSMT